MYRICPHCGSYLDPGERCDCSIEKAAPVMRTPEAAKEKVHHYFNQKKGKSQWGSSRKSLC